MLFCRCEAALACVEDVSSESRSDLDAMGDQAFTAKLPKPPKVANVSVEELLFSSEHFYQSCFPIDHRHQRSTLITSAFLWL